MAESPRRVDLRLTITGAAPFREVAVELAEKFAAYVGADPAAAKSLAQEIDVAIAPGAEAPPDKPIEMQMSAEGSELVVTTHAGSTAKRTTCPLPD